MLPEGPAGVRDTLYKMREWVRASKVAAPIRDKAVSLVMYTAPKDWYGQVYAVWRFVKDNIKYIRDINDVETLHWPEQVLSQGFGDCDDHSMLIAALLESIGHPTRFVAIGFDPDIFSHVYAETLVGNSWIPLETTEDVQIGWSPPGVVARYVVRN
jgi:transglutaminase-like putative cysteine protease